MLLRACYLFFIVLLTFQNVSAKEFTKCELAKELKRQGLSVDDMSNWICLIDSESKFKTHEKGGPNKNGSYDWGLFQINDGLWCMPGKKGHDCNIDCESLITDDITEAVKCAKKVYKRHGFRAWHGWSKKCKNKKLPDLSECHL